MLNTVLFVQLENPHVLNALQGQSMTPSQRQTVSELLRETLARSTGEMFNAALFAR